MTEELEDELESEINDTLVQYLNNRIGLFEANDRIRKAFQKKMELTIKYRSSPLIKASIETSCFVCPFPIKRGEEYVLLNGHPTHKKCYKKLLDKPTQ